MRDGANEGKKAELLSRVGRLRELIERDADADLLEEALGEVRRSLDGLTRPGRAEGDAPAVAAPGESPPSL